MLKYLFKKSLAVLLVFATILSIAVISLPAQATVKRVKCSKCDGRGTLWCSACSGTGYFDRYDVYTHSYYKYPCVRCYGAGRYTCSYCGGAGYDTIDIPEPKETSINRIVANTAGFSVSWKKQTDTTSGYQIQYATDSAFTNDVIKTVENISTTSLTITGLNANKKYYVRIRTYKLAYGNTYYSSWSSAKSVVTEKFKNPPKTAIAKIVSREAGFSVSWKKQTKNVTGYQIQYATNSSFNNGKTKSVKGRTNTTVLNLAAAKKYFVRVRTFRTYGGKNYFSAWSGAKSVVTKKIAAPPKTTVARLIPRMVGFSVSWKKQTTGVTGYQIQYATNNKFKGGKTKSVKGATNTTVLNLLSAKKYFVRVRTFRTCNGKNYFSGWSPAKSVVTKKVIKPQATKITEMDTDFAWSGYIELFFNKVQNCTGYQLQVSKYSNFSNAQLWTSPRNGSITDWDSLSKTNPWRWWLKDGYDYSVDLINSTNYTAGKYYFRIRTFNKVNGKTYYSSWSNVVSAKLLED